MRLELLAQVLEKVLGLRFAKGLVGDGHRTAPAPYGADDDAVAAIATALAGEAFEVVPCQTTALQRPPHEDSLGAHDDGGPPCIDGGDHAHHGA